MSALLIGAFFVLSTFVVGVYEVEIQSIVAGNGLLGMLAYTLLHIIAVIFAPISMMPLIPVGVAAWGWQATAPLTILGWATGSQIAFFLARRFGKPLVSRLVSLEALSRYEKKLPENNLFWAVVFLRMTIPVDILSYAFGLFSNMKAIPFLLATIIGITPFSLVFAYSGTLSVSLQITILLAAMTIAAILLFIHHKKSDIITNIHKK